MAKEPGYGARWPVYATLWDAMEIKPARKAEVSSFVKRALKGKPQYQEVEKRTGVPWWVVAILAERESGQDFSRSLAQGDRWDRRSTHVPAGRGPFKSWEDAAYDALVTLKGMDKIKDWRLEKAFYWGEKFNGWGYFWKGIPSPYVWGATTVQQRGKYIADGVFSRSHWDTQLGMAAMLRGLMDADDSLEPERET